MNILFISPVCHSEGDGWGQAAIDYAKALALTGHGLTIRPVYMTQSIAEVPVDLIEFVYSKYLTYDVIIQHCLPHMFDYYGGVKNIGLCHTETSHLQHVSWPSRLNLMDEIWVSSLEEKKNLQYSGVSTSIQIVKMPIDVQKFEQSYTNVLPALKDSFIFYFVGAFNERKNLTALLKAFHLEFAPHERVELVIKTSGPDIQIQELCQQVKSGLRIYMSEKHYKSEIVVTDKLSESNLMALHYWANCFVMPSYGEAVCRPMMDALGFGKTPIVTDHTGMASYVNNKNGWVVFPNTFQ